MSIKSILAVTLALVAGTALAQGSLGTVDQVKGVVTVSDGATGGTVASGASISSGMRFVASSNGSAVLKFNNGCMLNLQPGQAVTVSSGMTCEALLAAVSGGSAGGSMGMGAAASAGLVAGSVVLKNVLTKDSISSN